MIVIDVGCHPQGPEESVYNLIERFQPDLLLGFDPYPELVEGVECVGDTLVVRRRVAAWTRADIMPIRVEGITTGLTMFGDPDHVPVKSFDLPGLIEALPATAGIVLKLDAEGVEYPILADIVERDIDLLLERVLVEWHPEETAHDMWIEPRPVLRCIVEEWA